LVVEKESSWVDGKVGVLVLSMAARLVDSLVTSLVVVMVDSKAVMVDWLDKRLVDLMELLWVYLMVGETVVELV
jgi:hypothetical protein